MTNNKNVAKLVHSAVGELARAKDELDRRAKIAQKRADKWETPTHILQQAQLETEEGSEEGNEIDRWLDRIGEIHSRADRIAENLKQRSETLKKAINAAEDCEENAEADRRYAANRRAKRKTSLLERMARA